MAFDDATRWRLQTFVSDARTLLTAEFAKQFQQEYGLDPESGAIASLESLPRRNDRRLEIARLLREIFDHYLASFGASGSNARKAALDRMVREQAFTTLNRLAALRMMEARGIVLEAVAKGYQSKGFQLYQRVAGPSIGDTGETYRWFLLSVCDMFSGDLPALFDRNSPNGRLFPGEPALLALLEIVNSTDLDQVWGEDETIGWIYQYFNSKEERKVMRDASSAPRNSRELAVRNQFFTPRYVVEFLVDNTLGRLWFNWTGGQTGLRDQCQYLLVRSEENPIVSTRLRDPRTIKLLDPACGSMHFGLYAFDLLLDIYREAWEWEETNGLGCLDTEGVSAAILSPLTQTYQDLAAFLLDVPRLIIEYNIFGVDIDPRATQIASLALWLRAQRVWHIAAVKAHERPRIGRGHVVAAIAPPAEIELRRLFVTRLDSFDAELFEQTIFLLKDLPVLGALLQVEREIPELCKKIFGSHGRLFEHDDKLRWISAETRLGEALGDFSIAAHSNYQGRLFAVDALQGLRTIDILSQKYDVVVMNPPFGKAPEQTADYLKSRYGRSYYDLYSTFVDRAVSLVRKEGRVGCITSKTFFSTSRLRAFREWLLQSAGIDSCVDLGQGVLDAATVETAAYVLSDSDTRSPITFIDAQEPEARACRLRQSATEPCEFVYSVTRDALLAFPNCSFSSYWASPSLLSIFARFPSLDPEYAETAAGQMTGDDFRYVRARWEVDLDRKPHWELFAKGGDFFRYFCDWPLVVNWSDSAIVEYKKLTVRSVLISRRSGSFSGKPALAWNRVNEIGFNVRILPPNAKFADKAPAIFPKADPLSLLGILCSRLVDQLCALQNPNRMFEVRDVSSLPIPPHEPDFLRANVEEIIAIKIKWASSEETSSFFSSVTCKRDEITSFDELLQKTNELFVQDEERLLHLHAEISRYVDKIYGLSDSDTTLLNARLGIPKSESILERRPKNNEESNPRRFAERIVSYLVGVYFGRWDIRAASSCAHHCGSILPFSQVPPLSPGRLSAAIFEPNDVIYPVRISQDGTSTCERGGESGIVAGVREVASHIWGGASDRFEERILASLDVKSLDEYFSKPTKFFSDHLKNYTTGGRAAPIYWPLATRSSSFTVWIYYPRMTSQTLYTVVNNSVEPRLKVVSAQIAAARVGKIDRVPSAGERIEALQNFEMELIELRDDLLQLASSYRPNLEDGVEINASPLWSLFRHKSWQAGLKDTWTKLQRGDYDWAHLGMAYWPGRVRERCKTDKSLAIAHGLEELYEPPPARTTGVGRGGRKRQGAAP